MAVKNRHLFKNINKDKPKRQYVKKVKKAEIELPPPETEDVKEVKVKRFNLELNEQTTGLIFLLVIFIVSTSFILFFILSQNNPLASKGKSLGKTVSKTIENPVNTKPKPAFLPDLGLEFSRLDEKVRTLFFQTPPVELSFRRRDLYYINFDFDPPDKNWSITRKGGALVPSPTKFAGNALFLDESSSLIATGSSQNAGFGTLNFWIKLESDSTNGQEVPLIDWNFNGEKTTPFLFEISFLDSKMYFNIYDAKGKRNEIDVLLSDWTVWHHIQYTWDFKEKPSKLVVFIDRKKLAEGSFPIIPLAQKNPILQIGGGAGGKQMVPFSIDQVALTNWVKDDQEMAAEP